jgi:hypothetical protein
MENDLLTEEDLAARWKVTIITLAQWRWTGRGPRFFKAGRQIFYRPQDVLSYEERKSRQSTAYRDEEEEFAAYRLKQSLIKRRAETREKNKKHL